MGELPRASNLTRAWRRLVFGESNPLAFRVVRGAVAAADRGAGPTAAMLVATGVKVLIGTLFWEFQFQIVRAIFSGLPSKTEKERAFKRCAPSYIVSYVHAFFLTWAGWRIVTRLERADLAARAFLYDSAQTDPDFVFFVELTTLVFFTYVLYDMFHLIIEFPDLGGYDMAAHHVGFLIAAMGAYTYGAYPLVLGWLCTCETSTPVLSARWFVRQMKDIDYAQPLVDAFAKAIGMKSRGLVAANRIEYYIAIVFLFVFVLVRNLGYGWAMAGLFRVARAGDALEVHAAVPALARHGLCFLTVCGFCLNLMWTHKIVSMALSEKRRKWLRKDAEQ